MKDNLKKLEKIPQILEIKKLILDKELKDILGSYWSKEAIKNSRKILAYRIIYKSRGKKIVGYIVEPRKGNKLPCIIWNRGGSRDFGSIRQGQLFGVGRSSIAELALNGYIVIATQYPGVAGGEGIDMAGGDEDIGSILDLYKILRKYARADHTRVGMEGFSMGGLKTYMCLRKVKWIRAAVIGGAPTDEVNASKFRKFWEKRQKELYGGSMAEKKKRSALYWANELPKKTPLLIMHGTSDWRVNPMDSLKISERLFEYKIPHRLIMFEGADHGLTEHREEYLKQLISWFDRFVKGKEKLPNMKFHGK